MDTLSSSPTTETQTDSRHSLQVREQDVEEHPLSAIFSANSDVIDDNINKGNNNNTVNKTPDLSPRQTTTSSSSPSNTPPATPEEDRRIALDKFGFPVEPRHQLDWRKWHGGGRSKYVEDKKVYRWREVKAKDTLFFDKKKLQNLIRYGVPSEHRRMIWLISSGAYKKKLNSNINTESGNYYLELVAKCTKNQKKGKQLEVAAEIEKDLPRTFPEHEFFQRDSTKETMRRILLAFSKRNKSVGYCQGMNFLTGWLMLVLADEEDSFWLLTTIVEDLCPGFYSKSMINIQLVHKVLDDLLQEMLPEVHHHIELQFVSVPLLTTKWFMCLFLGSLPAETVVHLWDNLLIQGPTFLLKVALAIFKAEENEILQTKNTGDLLRTIQWQSMKLYDWKSLTKNALKLTNINDEKVEELMSIHRETLHRQMEEMRQRRDISELAKVTHFSPDELQKLKRQFLNVARRRTQRQSNSFGSATWGPTRNRRQPMSMNVDSAASSSSSTHHQSINTYSSLPQQANLIGYKQFQKIYNRIFVKNERSDDSKLKQLFKAFDSNGDGLVDFRELMLGLSILAKGTQEERLELCFKSYDLDNSGYLGREEFLFMLEGVYKNVYQINLKRASSASGSETIHMILPRTPSVDKVFSSSYTPTSPLYSRSNNSSFSSDMNDNNNNNNNNQSTMRRSNSTDSVKSFWQASPRSSINSGSSRGSQVKSMTLEQFVDYCFRNLDADGDDKLSLEEFKKVALIDPQLVECLLLERPQLPNLELERDISKDSLNMTESMDSKENLESNNSTALQDGYLSADEAPMDSNPKRPVWIPDSDVASCPYCNRLFVFFLRRKHHCRNCGKVVCNPCSSRTLPLPELGYVDPVRICENCYQSLSVVIIQTTDEQTPSIIDSSNVTENNATSSPQVVPVSSVPSSTTNSPRNTIGSQQQTSFSEVAAAYLSTLTLRPTPEVELP